MVEPGDGNPVAAGDHIGAAGVPGAVLWRMVNPAQLFRVAKDHSSTDGGRTHRDVVAARMGTAARGTAGG